MSAIKTQEELEAKLAALGNIDDEQKRDVVCALLGHSRIQTHCLGYFYCGRCDAQVGDNLGGVYLDAEKVVIVGHKCKTCEANYSKCDWRDKFMAPDPFADEDAA